MSASLPSTVEIPSSHLSERVLSNTVAYLTTIKPAPVSVKAKVCNDIAGWQLEKGFQLNAMATLSILARLPAIDAETSHDVEWLQSHIECERHWDRLLPPDFRILRCHEEEYGAILASGVFSPRELPFRTTSLGRQLYQLAAYRRGHDISFVLCRKSLPQAHVQCGIHLDEGATDCLAPIRIQLARDMPESKALQATEAAIVALEELGLRYGAANIRIEDSDMESTETPIGRVIRTRSYITNFCISLATDLTVDDKSMWRGIRKSFRSLINGSAKIINIRRFNSTLQDERIIQCWNHLRGITRNQLTDPLVKLVVDIIRRGNGEIAAGFSLEGNCIGVVVILDDCGKSLYYAGHFVEDGTGKRHSHYLLFDALRRAKARKSDRFYFSYFDPNPFEMHGAMFGVDPDMERGRFFMRGFSSHVQRHLTYLKGL